MANKLKKTGYTEAALTVIATSGFAIVQSYMGGGISDVSPESIGALVGGLFVFGRRYLQKKEEAKCTNS